MNFENRISGNRDTSVDERAPEREARATREDAPRPPVQIETCIKDGQIRC